MLGLVLSQKASMSCSSHNMEAEEEKLKAKEEVEEEYRGKHKL